jgi:hypothetical protein
MVARLTPDQEVACLNHVGVIVILSYFSFFKPHIQHFSILTKFKSIYYTANCIMYTYTLEIMISLKPNTSKNLSTLTLNFLYKSYNFETAYNYYTKLDNFNI